MVESWLDSTPRSRLRRRKRAVPACWSAAVDMVDEVNDNALLVPMMEQAEETTGTKSRMTLADAGYFAASHLA